MKTISVVLFALVFLSGCAFLNPPPDVGVTPAQRLYEIDGAYNAILEVSVGYKEECFRKPVELQGNCKQIVDGMRSLNNEYTALRNGITLGDNVEILQAGLRRFQAYLIKHAIKESVL
jgi:hypothetical protein